MPPQSPPSKRQRLLDIVFLFPQTKPNYEYLENKLGIKNGRELKEALLAGAANLDFDGLAEDIEPFLSIAKTVIR